MWQQITVPLSYFVFSVWLNQPELVFCACKQRNLIDKYLVTQRLMQVSNDEISFLSFFLPACNIVILSQFISVCRCFPFGQKPVIVFSRTMYFRNLTGGDQSIVSRNDKNKECRKLTSLWVNGVFLCLAHRRIEQY